MRNRLALLVPLLACAAASAQTPALVQEPLPQESRKNQKIERIHVEDNAVKIDELRVGGQTQSITVQPKSGLPAYEVQPQDPFKQRNADQRDGAASGAGQRVWNVLKF